MNETEEKAAFEKLDRFLADNDELEQYRLFPGYY